LGYTDDGIQSTFGECKVKRKNENVSIFVSSTFRDMQSERDALRDNVLPRINEFAAKYGRAVEIIDLRWGVDTASVSEEEQNYKVLRTCLDEIERSRPFFLGLIGDRYGWTPPSSEMSAVLRASQFSLEDMDMSITALEIECGVLRSDSPPVCLFYFRDSPDYAAVPKILRETYQDGADGLTRLSKLKEQIRTRHGSDVKNYTAEFQGNGLVITKEWSEMVAADIIIKLQQEWGEPSDIPLTWIEQEREAQETFRESRTVHFAGRTDAITDFSTFCLNEEPTPQLIMIQGEAGSGKSGLMCKVMDEIEKKCMLLPYCCGISSRSSLIENMLRYFIALLCKKLSLVDDSDSISTFQELKDRFIELLHVACRKMRVVAVVDALDQIASSDEARRMLWVNGRLPTNFRLLCSIIDGPETYAITQFDGEVRPVPPISKEDEAAIIHGIAARHHKQIGSAVVEYILHKQTTKGSLAAQNPLYLSLITQDLVMMDRYELDTVQQYMDGGLSQPEALAMFMRRRIDETPGDPEGAYLVMLERLEKLIGRDFVRGVCGLIAVSRSGLRESDLEGAFKELGMAFNSADFSWLRQILRGHFTQGDVQQWDFSHQSLRRAIWMDKRCEKVNDSERSNTRLFNRIKKLFGSKIQGVNPNTTHCVTLLRPPSTILVGGGLLLTKTWDTTILSTLLIVMSKLRAMEVFMFKRLLVSQLTNRLSEPRRFIQIVAGPRQTGKTTAVLQALDALNMPRHFVSADDPSLISVEWIRNEWEQARALAKAGEAILIIDEVQKIDKWSSIIKLLWDEDTRMNVPLKVILSGSSPLLLQKGLAESLMGRFEVLYSPHWNYTECKEAFGYTLDDFLFFGGYPGAAALIGDENRWARYMGTSIVEPTISQDILMMEEVRKPALLKSLFMLGSTYSAQELSFTKMLGQLQDSGNTVTLAHYLELLGKANMLTGLQNYSGSQIRTRKSSPRFMVYDTSLMTYADGANRRRLLDNAVDRGRLVESAVGAYLLARGKEEGFEVYWWRERSQEVDFVIKKGSQLTAIEVKSGRVKNAGTGLSFKKAYPEAFVLTIGSINYSLEDFLLGTKPLFL
jgi:hypothetical protein